jgi:ATP-dependent Clp protease, protease subunit
MGRRISEQVATLQDSLSQPQSISPEEALQSIMVQQGDNSRIVVLHGDVNEHTISALIVQLLQLANQNHNPIHLVVSTYGGSVDEMFSLYDAIKFLPCPVRTVALGKVMSAGVLILAAGEKGHRMIGRSARIMVHSMQGSISGNVFDLINETEECKRLQALMVDALLAETKMTKKQIDGIMYEKIDRYIPAVEAIKLGIVDKIIG